MQKAVCCVICPFFMLLEKKKERRSEAKSLSYPPPVLFCPPLFCLVLATATLLHSLFSLSLSLSLSYTGLKGERNIYTYLI